MDFYTPDPDVDEPGKNENDYSIVLLKSDPGDSRRNLYKRVLDVFWIGNKKLQSTALKEGKTALNIYRNDDGAIHRTEGSYKVSSDDNFNLPVGGTAVDRTIHYDCVAMGGDSGGPVFTSNHKIIGVHRSRVKDCLEHEGGNLCSLGVNIHSIYRNRHVQKILKDAKKQQPSEIKKITDAIGLFFRWSNKKRIEKTSVSDMLESARIVVVPRSVDYDLVIGKTTYFGWFKGKYWECSQRNFDQVYSLKAERLMNLYNALQRKPAKLTESFARKLLSRVIIKTYSSNRSIDEERSNLLIFSGCVGSKDQGKFYQLIDFFIEINKNSLIIFESENLEKTSLKTEHVIVKKRIWLEYES